MLPTEVLTFSRRSSGYGDREYTARSVGSLGSRCMPCRRDYHPLRAAKYLTVLLLLSGQCFPGVDRENVGKTRLRFENADRRNISGN
jgi:hypothetical protein